MVLPNKNYNRGRALEYRVMKEFKNKGYEVFRSAGSHSKADVIAIKEWLYADECLEGSKVILIQCKTGRHLMSVKEKQEFAKYAENLGCSAVLAYRIGRVRLITETVRKQDGWGMEI